MPFVQVPIAARDKAIELRMKAEAPDHSTWDTAFYYGYLDGLRALLPSESMGLIIMDCDCAAAGEELATDQMPKLVVTGG